MRRRCRRLQQDPGVGVLVGRAGETHFRRVPELRVEVLRA
jgi:hypothetical protein